MPTYSYRCECGETFDRILRLKNFDTPQMCACGKQASRVIVAPAVIGDYAGYPCPVTGKWIEGRKAHQENLARTGCRVLEPGETESAVRRRQEQEAAYDARIERTVEKLVKAMPPEKQNRLEAELTSGVSTEVVRL